jgi:hypothetical protein
MITFSEKECKEVYTELIFITINFHSGISVAQSQAIFDPFRISEAWALKFDAEMGRGSASLDMSSPIRKVHCRFTQQRF